MENTICVHTGGAAETCSTYVPLSYTFCFYMSVLFLA